MKLLTLSQFQTLDVVLELNEDKQTPLPRDVLERLSNRPPGDVQKDLATLVDAGYLEVADNKRLPSDRRRKQKAVTKN